MASRPVDRMDKAQRRRLMATLLAGAIAEGKLNVGAIDFAALLFGDPDLWTEFQRHGAMVEKVIATSPPAALPTSAKLVGKAGPTARNMVENDIVGTLGIEDARDRGGSGEDGDDIEYRRIHSRLKNYTRYLAERADYEELNRSLQASYTQLSMGPKKAGDLAKEFSLPLADVALCQEEVQALIAVSAAPDGADLRSFVPKTENGNSRRKLVLIDTTGRPRWGRRKAGGARPAVQQSVAEMKAAPSEPSSELDTITLMQAEREVVAPTWVDVAVLRARVGLAQDDGHGASLPDDWKTAALSIPRIIELLPYPRLCHLDTALSAFGHPSQEACIRSDPAIEALLEADAAPWRSELQKQANEGEAQRLLTTKMISDRWWRAVIFYRAARRASGDAAAGPRWPESWEYLSAPREDIYTPQGWSLVVQLNAIMNIFAALANAPEGSWESILGEWRRRGAAYNLWAKVAQEPGVLRDRARLTISIWSDSWKGCTLPEMLPGFVD